MKNGPPTLTPALAIDMFMKGASLADLAGVVRDARIGRACPDLDPKPDDYEAAERALRGAFSEGNLTGQPGPIMRALGMVRDPHLVRARELVKARLFADALGAILDWADEADRWPEEADKRFDVLFKRTAPGSQPDIDALERIAIKALPRLSPDEMSNRQRAEIRAVVTAVVDALKKGGA